MPVKPHASASDPKQVLIVGGGFAGAQAAIELQKEQSLEVTLVSDRDFLWLYPTSIWIPTREMEFVKAQVSLARMAKRHGFKLIIDTAQAVRSAENTVSCAGGDYEYDYLVLAIGAEKLKPKGVEHTLSICGKPEVSLEIRDRLDALIEKGSGSIAVGFGGNARDSSAVRGGPAFEVLFNIHHLLTKRKMRDQFQLTFFAPMASPGTRMGDRALEMMDKMFERSRLDTRVGTKIAGFDEAGVRFEDGSRLDADLVLFIPGVSGHSVMGHPTCHSAMPASCVSMTRASSRARTTSMPPATSLPSRVLTGAPSRAIPLRSWPATPLTTSSRSRPASPIARATTRTSRSCASWIPAKAPPSSTGTTNAASSSHCPSWATG